MRVGHALGTIDRIYRYPVKSLAGQPLARATVGEYGLDGDRRAALFVATDAHARAGKPYRGKENRLLHTVETDDAAAALASDRGVAVDVRHAGPYFDDSPVSIVFDTWLEALENMIYEPLDPLRFRPNIYVKASADFRATEAELVGKSFAIGDVRMQCTATIKRCVTITYDIPTGTPDPRIGAVVANQRDNVMGVYCTVVRGGELVTGAQLLDVSPGA